VTNILLLSAAHSFEGPGALQFLQTITPTDLTVLEPNQSTLSVLLHPVTGGIVDDLIITPENPSSVYVVTNAACKGKDNYYLTHQLAHFNTNSPGADVSHTVLADQGLIALQGPLAKDVLQEYIDSTPARGKLDLSTLYFGYATTVAVPLGAGNIEELHIARGGYTGEDGFEISISPRNTEAVTQALLDVGARGDRVKLTGLGARDSLRLEAGMCLYGHDIDDSTTPIEAGLKWLVGKNRVMEGYV
jgi:aminomethyltransferase